MTETYYVHKFFMNFHMSSLLVVTRYMIRYVVICKKYSCCIFLLIGRKLMRAAVPCSCNLQSQEDWIVQSKASFCLKFLPLFIYSGGKYYCIIFPLSSDELREGEFYERKCPQKKISHLFIQLNDIFYWCVLILCFLIYKLKENETF